jgi:hypothetical protein
MRKIYILAGIALLAIACNGSKRSSSEGKAETSTTSSTEVTEQSYEAGTRRMKRPVESLSEIRDIETLNYVIEHYWDDFDYDCGERIIEYDTTDICQALVDYASIVRLTGDLRPMRSFIERAETSRPVLEFFITISEMVLHDPNSPMRDDELYIPILEHLVTSPLLDEYERLIPEHDLRIASQNRIGMMANDFEYTLKDGTTGRLHDIDADYTILMFNNPDCPMCREIIDEIGASPMLNEMQELGRVRVIAVYPDSDLEAWHRYHAQMPRRWIVSYDDGCFLDNNDLYNLSAIPSLYLLDVHKRVIIKDGISVMQIEDAIAYMETYN